MKHRRWLTYERRRMAEGMMFVSVWLIGFLAFMLYPLASSFKMSFTQSKLPNITEGPFVGLDNYKAVITDPSFGIYFTDTVVSSIVDIPIIIMFSLFVAVLLNKVLLGRLFFRAVFFAPAIIAGVVMRLLYDQDVSQVAIFDQLGGGTAFLNELFGAGLIDRIGVIMWRSSVEILIFLGGLQSIPRSQYEAAEVDGATVWECFWKITLPFMSPVVLLNVIYATIDAFTGPLNVMIIYMRDKIFYNLDFGFALAMSWLYLAAILVFVLIIVGVGRRFVFYAGDRT